MPVHRLGRADRNIGSMCAEHLPDRFGFFDVACQSCWAVGIDVVDVLRLQLRIAQGVQYGARLPGGIRFGDVAASFGSSSASVRNASQAFITPSVSIASAPPASITSA